MSITYDKSHSSGLDAYIVKQLIVIALSRKKEIVANYISIPTFLHSFSFFVGWNSFISLKTKTPTFYSSLVKI